MLQSRMNPMRTSPRWIVAVSIYVAVVAVLTWTWVRHDSGGFQPAELATIVLVLPVGLILVPVAYVILAGAWAISGASQGSGQTPIGIQIVYIAVFAAVAFGNAVAVSNVGRVLRSRSAGARVVGAGPAQGS